LFSLARDGSRATSSARETSIYNSPTPRCFRTSSHPLQHLERRRPKRGDRPRPPPPDGSSASQQALVQQFEHVAATRFTTARCLRLLGYLGASCTGPPKSISPSKTRRRGGSSLAAQEPFHQPRRTGEHWQHLEYIKSRPRHRHPFPFLVSARQLGRLARANPFLSFACEGGLAQLGQFPEGHERCG
jgi:hypothetical protein